MTGFYFCPQILWWCYFIGILLSPVCCYCYCFMIVSMDIKSNYGKININQKHCYCFMDKKLSNTTCHSTDTDNDDNDSPGCCYVQGRTMSTILFVSIICCRILYPLLLNESFFIEQIKTINIYDPRFNTAKTKNQNNSSSTSNRNSNINNLTHWDNQTMLMVAARTNLFYSHLTTTASNTVRAYAAANPNPNPNMQVVPTSKFIQIDYLCAAGMLLKQKKQKEQHRQAISTALKMLLAF